MRLYVKLLLVILSALSLCGLQPALTAPQKPSQTQPPSEKKVWEFHQIHSGLGPVVLFIAADGIFIRNDDFTWGFICKAPDWKAVFYRPGEKHMSITPYKTWLKQGFAVSDLVDDVIMPVTATTETGTLCGLPVVSRRWSGTAPKLTVMSESIIGAKKCTYLFSTTKAIGAPLQVTEVLSRFYKVPELPGIPLSLRTSQRGEGRVLVTSSAAPTRVSSLAFEEPKGFTLLKSDGAVWVEDDDRKDVEAIGRDMFGK